MSESTLSAIGIHLLCQKELAECKRRTDLVQAFLDGKTIECRPIPRIGMFFEWTVVVDPTWLWDSIEYRIQPEDPVKKHRELSRKRAEVMLAYAQGSMVEYRYDRRLEEDSWESIEVPCWDWSTCEYRVVDAKKEQGA